MPRGVTESDGRMRISVALDKQVFDAVCAYGASRGWSFSVTINDLTQRGLKVAEQTDWWARKVASQ